MANLTPEELALKNLGMSISEMVKSPGWERGILPHLKELATHSWLDPQDAKDQEDFFYKYAVSWAKAKSADELLKWVGNQISQAQALQNKENGITTDKFEAFNE